jgi:hypothetical protein
MIGTLDATGCQASRYALGVGRPLFSATRTGRLRRAAAGRRKAIVMPISAVMSKAIVAGSGTAATSIKERFETHRPCAKGVSPGRVVRASAAPGKFPSIGVRNQVDLVDRRGRAESRVELRQRQQDQVAICPGGHDVLVQDIGIVRVDQGKEQRAGVGVAVDGLCDRTDILRVRTLKGVGAGVADIAGQCDARGR